MYLKVGKRANQALGHARRQNTAPALLERKARARPVACRRRTVWPRAASWVVNWPAPHDRQARAHLVNRAMQGKMLRIDNEHAAAWHDAMTTLVEAYLDFDMFTEQRMEALETWTRG